MRTYKIEKVESYGSKMWVTYWINIESPISFNGRLSFYCI